MTVLFDPSTILYSQPKTFIPEIIDICSSKRTLYTSNQMISLQSMADILIYKYLYKDIFICESSTFHIKYFNHTDILLF